MSALYSTPPSAGKRSHPVGFNDQTYIDPFFPSSPSEEQLVEVISDHSPGHQSHRTASPPLNLKPNDIGLRQSGSPPNNYNYLQLPSHTALNNGIHSTPSPQSHGDQDASYDFLSPNAYMSDNGYNASSEHTATPDFIGSFCLEDDFGFLGDPDQDVELDKSTPFQDTQTPRTSADVDSPHNSNYTSASVGAATLSSHLMSPVLTASPGSGSRRCTTSPPIDAAYIKSEAPDAVHSALHLHNIDQGNMNDSFGPMQQTPTLTESSKGTSPDLTSAVPVIARAPSPVVHVEKYTRGDSPARGAGFPGRSGSKRSRTGSHSSHPAMQYNGNISEEEEAGDGYTRARNLASQDAGRVGFDPEARFHVSGVEIPNLKDQEVNAQKALKDADVEEWLARSEAGSEDGADAAPQRPSLMSKRQRARSAGAQNLSQANLEILKTMSADSHIPGPGVLINEESGDEDDNDYDEDEVASIEDSPPPTIGATEPVNEVPGEARPGVYDELPTQPPLYRAKLWQDPLYDSSDPGVKMQPGSSNDAIVRFEQRAGDIETMSRVATWGTRRLSESDLQSLFHRFSFSDKANDQGKEKREQRGSFLEQAAAKLLPKRNSGLLRRHESETSKQQIPRSSPPEHQRNDSHGSRKESLEVPQSASKGLQRMSSLGKRPKSPRINTGSAVAAMAHMAALGASGPVSATAKSSPTGVWPRNVMKRTRSPSDLNGLSLNGPSSSSATELGLADLWTRQGGPPMPTLAAPPKNEEYNSLNDAEDEDEDEAAEDHGVIMDLSIRSDSIVPTLEGFKANIRQLNPRLPPFMFDRIAQEQLRRFKKLMDCKIKHAQALSTGKCASGKRCIELGGEPIYLPSKSSSREPELSHTGFSIAGLGQSDDDVNALADGIVTPAQFPPGVPMPPVKRLPAEFECSLCFKVKKFHKPSDWSKHVHEDVQPFTCTFPTCAEPKSFKRKADWVRHENERHRQLEWWMCNMNECSHKCYRKDNFVQHLVREHKLPEPKVKTTKNGKPAVRGPSAQKSRNKHADDDDSNDEIDQVWRLVEECRHETPKKPKDEACKFCGNICNSWKKLTVHLAKHMEQISMPVLGVIKQKDVTPETIISPIEQRLASQQASTSPTVQSPFTQVNSTSPYGIPMVTMGELPGTFTSMQPQGSYLGTPEHQIMNFQQRVSPATYPPPRHAQQLATSYVQSRGSPYPISDYSSYRGSPAPQFNPVNGDRGFSHPQTSSPENMYGGLKPPTSQPHAVAYDNESDYQYAPQQQAFSSPIDTPTYQFSNPTPYPQQTTPPTSYSQQTTTLPTSYAQPNQAGMPSPSYSPQQASMNGKMAMQYNQMYQMQNFPQANGNASLYTQQQQQQQHGFLYGQH
ncbi:hypothetical protein MMC28_000178 [Mycoblastus sanguinarius]|nr:hypothetical protein [Mycoblastus sanguinarius]